MTDLPNLRGGHLENFKWFITLVIGSAGFGGFIWQAAKAPDRSEFNSLRDQVINTSQTTNLTEDRLKRVQDDIAWIRADIKAIRESNHDAKRR